MPLLRLICNYNDCCQDRASTIHIHIWPTSSPSPFPQWYVDLIQGVLSRQGGAACTNSLALLSATTNTTTFSTQHNFWWTQIQHNLNTNTTKSAHKIWGNPPKRLAPGNTGATAGCQGKQRLALFYTLPATLPFTALQLLCCSLALHCYTVPLLPAKLLHCSAASYSATLYST